MISPGPRTRSADEASLLARFRELYKRSREPAMLEVERAVCGCDYGSTSWTTRDEAERVGELLRLGPGKSLLDLGAGSGWPGLYWARATGCHVTLTDIPIEGLRVAADRAVSDRLSGQCWAVAADAAELPFQSGCFDAVSHSDVLCCLQAKVDVLRECRRVLRRQGRMSFSVISVPQGLSVSDHQRAMAAGPPFKAVSTEYAAMLARTGWNIVAHADLTVDYAVAVRRTMKEEQTRQAGLVELFGAAAVAETSERRRRTADAVDAGLLVRELFTAVPASD